MNEQELPNLQGVRDCLIADEASHVANTTFCFVIPTDSANCVLRFLEFLNRRGINLVARTRKVNKAPVVVGRPALRCLS